MLADAEDRRVGQRLLRRMARFESIGDHACRRRPRFRNSIPRLRQALRRETELFVESQLREDRPAMELWTAKYTYVNDRLARHYGIPNVAGPEFRRVTLEGT